jgi:hypothetical protein
MWAAILRRVPASTFIYQLSRRTQWFVKMAGMTSERSVFDPEFLIRAQITRELGRLPANLVAPAHRSGENYV